MATVEEEAEEERPAVTQLEFRQAMRDFKTMFPEMDEDVIEVVLRSNHGAVDCTIDQLLAMSTDNENERIRAELDASEEGGDDELPPRYSPSTPPPSYHQAVPSFARPSAAEESAAGATEVPPTKVLEERGKLPDILENGDHLSEVALKVVREWNPPLLGKLPPTFLKISRPNAIAKPNAVAKANQIVKPKPVIVLTTTMLERRMQENHRQRQADVQDPEVQRFLQDERIALFLQNKEFFNELKDNKEFLSTLDRASPDVSSPDEVAGEGGAAAAEGGQDDPYLEARDPPEETDAAFREKIKNMGKVSRKKFTQLAKLFSRRKRRSFKPILGDGSNPSRDNLLLHEDEYSELSEDDSESEANKKDTWNSHVGGPGGSSHTIERSKVDS